MKYAAVTIGGHQYLVHEGQIFNVQKLSSKEGQSFTIEKVHLVFDDAGNDVQIGTPFVAEATVHATKVKEFKDKKVMVVKFKPKTRYHKRVGHRQVLNKIKIEKIG